MHKRHLGLSMVLGVLVVVSAAQAQPTFGPDDHLYVSDPFGSRVVRFDGLTGAFIDVFVAPGSGGLQIPLVLLFHGDHLYVGDPGAHEIRRYDARTGAYVDTFVKDSPDNPCAPASTRSISRSRTMVISTWPGRPAIAS